VNLSIYEFDLIRLEEFLNEKFPYQEFIDEEEYDQAYAEYESLYPMDLVVYESKTEMIFYNRPVGEMQHYWKIPGTNFIWKDKKFIKNIPMNFIVSGKLLFAKINKSYKPRF
jgi:hypothetical protein